MKNFIFTFFICFSILSFVSPLWAENEPFGNVVTKTGEVTVIRKFKKVLPAVQDILLEKDLVRTAENSTLDIEMGEQNNIHIGEKSNIRLVKEKKDDKEEINLELMAGTVRCKLDKLEGRQFIVRTPTAVAGVRGTDFVTSFDPDLGPKAFGMTVISGVVEVSVLDEATKVMGEATSVRPNQQIVVSNDGKSVAVSEVTPAKMETLRQQMPVKNDKMPEKNEGKEDKKSEGKKDDKKAEDKKADDKKAEDKKPEGKKADDKKAEDKADNKNPENKKTDDPKASQNPGPGATDSKSTTAPGANPSASVASSESSPGLTSSPETPLVETTPPDLNLGAEAAASSVDSIVQEQAAAAAQQVLDTEIQNVINDVQKEIETTLREIQINFLD